MLCSAIAKVFGITVDDLINYDKEENYKKKVIKASDIDSEVTGMSTGHPVRSLRNKMTREYLELEKQGADFMELEKLTLGSLRNAVIDGDVVSGTVMAGQIAGLIKEEKSCKEIVEDIMAETETVIKQRGELWAR